MMNTRDTVYTNTDEEYREICDFLDALSTKDPFMTPLKKVDILTKHGIVITSDQINLW